MARDDDPWKRIREREEEEEESGIPQLPKPGSKSGPSARGGETGGGVPEDKIHQWVEQATPMIEQLNNLYNQYFAGVERLPPTERRKHLDQLMVSIQNTSKPTTGLQFKSNTLMQQYNSAKDRWDRMLRDLESGKIKRPGGPKK